jgi:hypothetical protein
MPFNRYWDDLQKQKLVDRTRTGLPSSPETGKVQAATGNIVGDSASISIPQATPIAVAMPGPREPVIDARGIMTPRWRRFFEELYRRTGGYEDNINNANRELGTSTTGSVAITGYAPTVA